MVFTHGENGWVPSGYKGVDGRISGVRVQGRPMLGLMGCVKDALGSRGVMVEAAQQWSKDRKK